MTKPKGKKTASVWHYTGEKWLADPAYHQQGKGMVLGVGAFWNSTTGEVRLFDSQTIRRLGTEKIIATLP